MNTRCPGLLAVLTTIVTSVSPAHAAGLDYATAMAQSKEDALNPAYRDWYLNQMRPAFSAAVRQGLAECVPLDAEGRPAMGMVLVVDDTGAVRQSVARGDSTFDRCLQTKLAAHRYPAAPKADFHFGFEANASPEMPRTRGQADEVAARVGAPKVPEASDCSKWMVKQDRVSVPPGANGSTLVTGWTLVGFDLAGDGQPRNIRIDQSTGQAMLDQYALGMVSAQTYREGIAQACQLRLMIEKR